MDTIELIEELAAFDPQYQTRYTKLADAAKAAGLEEEFAIWLATSDGIAYSKVSSAHDHAADNVVRIAQLDADRNMFTRNRSNTARGYVSEGDEV